MYSIPFICILLIIILGLANNRGMSTYQLYSKRKRRHSQKRSMTIPMNPFSNPNVTIIPLEDDEELMKSDISLNFCNTNSIELRLEQEPDFDNDINDN